METRCSGPGLVLHFGRVHFFTLLGKKCLVTLHGYYWQPRVLLLVEASACVCVPEGLVLLRIKSRELVC